MILDMKKRGDFFFDGAQGVIECTRENPGKLKVHLCTAQVHSKPKQTRKKGGGSTFLTPPPRTPPLKKVGFKWGGFGGGSIPKTHWGMCLGVKLTIQPLGVGYTNRPVKPQNGGGGYMAFSHMYGPT